MRIFTTLALLLLAVVLFVPAASAQQFENTVSGQIYAGTACTTAGACVSLRLPLGAASATMTIAATSDAFTGTLSFEASADGINYVAIPGAPASTGVGTLTATAAGTWRFNVSAFRFIRVRCSAYTDGTLTVFILGSTAPLVVAAPAA